MMNELEEEQEGRGGEEEQGATREGWSGQNVVQGILRVCKKTGCGSTSLVQYLARGLVKLAEK